MGISIFLGFGLALPSSADAGVLDLFSSVLSSKVTYTAESSYTSQTLPLPRAARNLDPNPAKGGGDIVVLHDAVVPESGPEGSVTDFAEGAKSGGQISVYIVRDGDSLGSIAQMFGVSTNTIKWANDLKSSTIHPGQELVILPVSGIRYTVKNSGTLRDIIKKYGGDIGEAVEYNGVGPDEELDKGTVVIIPNGEIAEPRAVARTVVRTATKASTSASAHDTGGVYISGYFVDPLNGAGIVTQNIHGYNAVDIGVPVGTPIVAAAGGTVALARASGWNGGYGLYTIITHPNGVQTVYAHMSKNISYTGQEVQQGQVIGYSGNTGRSTGPHLHFETRGAANPVPYLRD